MSAWKSEWALGQKTYLPQSKTSSIVCALIAYMALLPPYAYAGEDDWAYAIVMNLAIGLIGTCLIEVAVWRSLKDKSTRFKWIVLILSSPVILVLVYASFLLLGDLLERWGPW